MAVRNAPRGGPLPRFHGEDQLQLPALLVPAERGDALFIKERCIAGDMGVKIVRPSPFKIEMMVCWRYCYGVDAHLSPAVCSARAHFLLDEWH